MASGTIINPLLVGYTIHKTLSSGDDLNNINGSAYSGFYVVGTSVSHAPESWCLLLVIGTDVDACRQVIISGSHIYIRAYAGNPRTWTNWVRFDGTTLTS